MRSRDRRHGLATRNEPPIEYPITGVAVRYYGARQLLDARRRGTAARHRPQWPEFGKVHGETDCNAVTRLRTPDAYDLTVQTSLAAVDRVMNGTISPGFQTPAMAFGPDFILEVTGVTRTDEAMV